MNAEEFAALLTKLCACEDAYYWAYGKSLAEAWAQCERGDWMLWLCGRMHGRPGWPSLQERVLAACACIEPAALQFVPAGEELPRLTLEAARRWARGEASTQEVRDALAALNKARFMGESEVGQWSRQESYLHSFDYASSACSYVALSTYSVSNFLDTAVEDAARAAGYATTQRSFFEDQFVSVWRDYLKLSADRVRSMIKIEGVSA